jgi:hypothetical protein
MLIGNQYPAKFSFALPNFLFAIESTLAAPGAPQHCNAMMNHYNFTTSVNRPRPVLFGILVADISLLRTEFLSFSTPATIRGRVRNLKILSGQVLRFCPDFTLG